MTCINVNLLGSLTCHLWNQIAAELPMDSDEADMAKKSGTSTLLYIFGQGYFQQDCQFEYFTDFQAEMC